MCGCRGSASCQTSYLAWRVCRTADACNDGKTWWSRAVSGSRSALDAVGSLLLVLLLLLDHADGQDVALHIEPASGHEKAASGAVARDCVAGSQGLSLLWPNAHRQSIPRGRARAKALQCRAKRSRLHTWFARRARDDTSVAESALDVGLLDAWDVGVHLDRLLLLRSVPVQCVSTACR